MGKAAFEYVERVLAQLMESANSRASSLEAAVQKRRGEEDGRELRYGTWQGTQGVDGGGGGAKEERSSEPSSASAAATMAAAGEAKVKAKAVFAEHACRDAPMPLDEGTCPLSLELPSVGHAGMDADHAEIEDLMGACVRSLRWSDVEALRVSFARHSMEEEDLMRRSSFGGGGGNDGMFSAVDSHAADHESIQRLAKEVAASADDSGLVLEPEVRRLCRSIVEHAVNFDSRYAGHMDQASSKKTKR